MMKKHFVILVLALVGLIVLLSVGEDERPFVPESAMMLRRGVADASGPACGGWTWRFVWSALPADPLPRHAVYTPVFFP